MVRCLLPGAALQAWEWQKRLVELTASQSPSQAEASGSGSGSSAPSAASPSTHAADACDVLLLLQHPPVYTLGTGSTTDNLKFDPQTHHIPLVRTERGGEVTYHGPGQVRRGGGRHRAFCRPSTALPAHARPCFPHPACQAIPWHTASYGAVLVMHPSSRRLPA